MNVRSRWNVKFSSTLLPSVMFDMLKAPEKEATRGAA